MKRGLKITVALGILLMLGAGQNAEARTHFSFNFGVAPEYYVAPSYYVEPAYVPYYAPHYVVPQRYYYEVPQQCYQVYEYGPFGPVYRTVCH